MTERLVSIIMPAYNSERFIAEAIQSVINQSYQNWELIVVDDCSRDNTREIIEKLASQESRILSVYRNKNGGKPSIAKNSAFDFINGSFVAFLDSDDLWLPDKLQKQLEIIEQDYDFGLCYTGGYLIDVEGIEIGSFIPKYKFKNIFNKMLFRYEINNQSVMIKRELLSKFNENITIGEDFNLFMNIVYCHKVCNVKEKLVKYRVHPSSITKSKNKDLSEGTLFTLQELNKKYNIFKKYPFAYIFCWLKSIRFKFYI